MVLKILVSPASTHYFTDKAGSIYSISYNLLSLLNALGVKLFPLINNIDPAVAVSPNIQFTRVGREVEFGSECSKWGDIYFLVKSPWFSKQIIKDKNIDIIHHMTPFICGITFNPLIMSSALSKYPFVIGPAEIPHIFLYDDYLYTRTKKPHPFIKLEWHTVKLLRKIVKLFLRPLSLKTLDKCDVLIAVNNTTKKEYSKVMDSNKIRVIPLGVDLNEFKFSDPPLNQDILTVGLHIQRKGFDHLIKAMPEILKECPDARLHIPSSGPRTDILKALVKDLGIESNVIFHGYISRSELLELYRNCRLFCHPSLSEGFCHTILEAMATGRPVVSTRTNGSEMVEDGKTGFLVPPADSDALADAIVKIFADDELTHRMGVEGRKKVEEEYDWNIIAKKYYEVYQEVVK